MTFILFTAIMCIHQRNTKGGQIKWSILITENVAELALTGKSPKGLSVRIEQRLLRKSKKLYVKLSTLPDRKWAVDAVLAQNTENCQC